MKKLFLMCVAAMVVFASCGEDPKPSYSPDPESALVTTDYIIVNQIESDIVVELKSDGGQIITIEPGDTEEVHRAKEQFVLREGGWYDTENRPVDEVLYEYYRVLDAEMKIDGEAVSDVIWRDDYWDIDSESFIEKSLFVINRAGILTVTDELLETVNNQ